VNGPEDVSRPPVRLTDQYGKFPAVQLRDGAEVEVLAWRPRGSAGTRYRVRDQADGADGWLGADELRTTAIRPSAKPAPAESSATSPSVGGSRPFGRT
jgi:hypothetical protein